jgi:hypothetical protein
MPEVRARRSRGDQAKLPFVVHRAITGPNPTPRPTLATTRRAVALGWWSMHGKATRYFSGSAPVNGDADQVPMGIPDLPEALAPLDGACKILRGDQRLAESDRLGGLALASGGERS